jgi:hypothetical protein
MSLWQAYRDDIAFSFRKQKEWAEQAFGQLDDAEFFRKPGEHSNSVALIVKHVAGNLKSRWTDFLISDGEKPWRERDNEFVIKPEETRARLLAAWEEGWSTLFATLAGLGEGDLLKKITIRGEGHLAMQAIHRSLTHVSYHVGQVLYVARLVRTGEWRWVTIAPGQSRQYRAEQRPYLK